MNSAPYLNVTLLAISILFSANVYADVTEAEYKQPIKTPQVSMNCTSGHHYSGNAGASLGFDTNTRPPSETITSGGGGGGPGGGGPPSQPLVDEKQSDTFANVYASIKHGYCLSTEQDPLAVMWITRIGIKDNRYLDLIGADKQSISFTTGTQISSNRVWHVSPVLDFETSNLEGDPYRKRIGVSSKQIWNILYNWQASFRISAGRIEFDQIPNTVHVEGHDKSIFLENSILLSPIYRIKIGIGLLSQSTDDLELNYSNNTFQLELSRWNSFNCDNYLRYRIDSSEYESLTTSGSHREDNLSGIELGGCARINSNWITSASLQRNISDSNVAEFDYEGTILELSMLYRY